jgi:hypothetical protein
MNQKPTNEHTSAKHEKDALPANLDKLKIQLEQLAAERQANASGESKNVAPAFGGR